jgi:hypothetical protein
MPPKGGIFLGKSMDINPVPKGQIGRRRREGDSLD